MFRLDLGPAGRYCDGMSRRNFLALGVAGMAGVGLPQLLRARAASSARKDTSVILIWLDGGPSHMDLYDLKPEAPAEYRGLWKPIRTNVPGIEISELFPMQAKVAACASASSAQRCSPSSPSQCSDFARCARMSRSCCASARRWTGMQGDRGPEFVGTRPPRFC